MPHAIIAIAVMAAIVVVISFVILAIAHGYYPAQAIISISINIRVYLLRIDMGLDHCRFADHISIYNVGAGRRQWGGVLFT